MMADLMDNHPKVKDYMWEQIMKSYDDDLYMFLQASLGNVDYLRRFANSIDPDERDIVRHLALVMNANRQEQGTHLFRADDKGVDELVVVFDGLIELYTVMDNGTECTVEFLAKGSIINSHSYLVGR